jgi:hypothetical protein
VKTYFGVFGAFCVDRPWRETQENMNSASSARSALIVRDFYNAERASGNITAS